MANKVLGLSIVSSGWQVVLAEGPPPPIRGPERFGQWAIRLQPAELRRNLQKRFEFVSEHVLHPLPLAGVAGDHLHLGGEGTGDVHVDLRFETDARRGVHKVHVWNLLRGALAVLMFGTMPMCAHSSTIIPEMEWSGL